MPRRVYFAPAPISLGVSNWEGHALPDAGGTGLVIANVSVAEHTSILALPGVTYLPFETAGGALVPADGTMADVSAANRTLLTTRFEAQHIPTHDVGGSDTVRAVVIRAIRRMVLRQILGADDWTELLDSLVSAIPAQKRANINAKLTAAGYDTSGIQGSDTVREAIRKIAVQLVRLSRTGND